MDLYLVLVDNGGAHESDNITSVWSSFKLAKEESDKINKEIMSEKYVSNVRSGVKKIKLDKAYDSFHDY